MSSYTLTLSGDCSELSANYYPPIELDQNVEYMCGLIDFQTFMSIPNVTEKNNKVGYSSEFRCELSNEVAQSVGVEVELIENEEKETVSKCLLSMAKKLNVNLTDKKNILSARREKERDKIIFVVEYIKFLTIPIGSYELADIVKYINDSLTEKDSTSFIDIRINNNTLKCKIKSNKKLIFDTNQNTIGTLLGFKDGVLEPNVLHISDNVIKINSINAIKIETNITTGAYSNDKLMRTLHEFYPTVDVGYKIVEVPRQVIYLPVSVRSISNFIVRIVDQDNNLIDFSGETITLRVHIKRL